MSNFDFAAEMEAQMWAIEREDARRFLEMSGAELLDFEMDEQLEQQWQAGWEGAY